MSDKEKSLKAARGKKLQCAQRNKSKYDGRVLTGSDAREK